MIELGSLHCIEMSLLLCFGQYLKQLVHIQKEKRYLYFTEYQCRGQMCRFLPTPHSGNSNPVQSPKLLACVAIWRLVLALSRIFWSLLFCSLCCRAEWGLDPLVFGGSTLIQTSTGFKVHFPDVPANLIGKITDWSESLLEKAGSLKERGKEKITLCKNAAESCVRIPALSWGERESCVGYLNFAVFLILKYFISKP